jgi:serine/threonine-protein kinase
MIGEIANTLRGLMLKPGDEFEGYRIERLLGRGGMGEVYEAIQTGLGRRVAIKVLHDGLIGDEEFRDRFRREGRLQATLDHPNVVTVYEAGEIDEGLFLAMQLIDGPTLKKLIGADGLDPEQTVSLLSPIADALDTAHRNGLVHRDVKPQNILVGKGGTPYLADFGLTRGPGHTAFTRSGAMVGTVDYISPEQVRGEPATAASDVYAFTAVLYECLTGSVPYELGSDAAVLYAHVNNEPPQLDEAGLPAGVGTAIAGGMAKDQARRTTNCSAVIGAVAGAIGGPTPPRRAAATAVSPLPSAAPAGGGGDSTAPTQRLPGRRSFALAIGLAALVVVGVAALLIGGAEKGSSSPGLTTSVSGSTVAFRAPRAWEPSIGNATSVAGMNLEGAIAAAPPSASTAGATAGTTDATGEQLLPATFVSQLESPLPEPDAVDLGRLEALRYRDLDLRGSEGEVTVYASPTTAGVATLVCASAAGEPVDDETCDAIATTLSLTRGRGLPLATPASIERRLAATVSSLDDARKQGRQRLHHAADVDAQVAAANALAGSFTAAAKQLDRIQPGPALAGEVEAASAAAHEVAKAYEELAAATKGGDRAAYREAAQQVDAAEKRLQTALAKLG